MSLICSICNEVPEVPVVSPSSGNVFERRLIEKYINDHGKDPISGDEITVDQLVSIKSSPLIKPRPPTATSIPAILKMLQDEWDACMLHSFTLRQQLQTARQEFSHTLYQHDAACRVIARLTKELTAAREALATLKPQGGLSQTGGQQFGGEVEISAAAGGAGDQEMEEVGLTEEIIKKLQEKAAVLTAARKQRGKTIPSGLAKADDIKTYKMTATHTGLHSASIPGITALDINDKLVVTGGNDKSVVVFDWETEKTVATLKGHQKKVSCVILHPTDDICLSASVDSTIRTWSITDQTCQNVIKAHDAAVTAISLHATGDYVLSASQDQHWAFSDIRTGRVLCRVADNTSPQAMTCAQFHPDGLIFGTGSADALVKIWDLKEKTNVANFPGHSGAVSAISFSENGYYLATAADDATVRLWDLRKLKNFKNIVLGDKFEVKDLCFDNSGTYLAIAGTDIRVYQCKSWQELCVLNNHSDIATGIRFGSNASFLASASMDRTLQFYGTVTET